MVVFHAYRWIAGCELVGIKTCGSTLSNACSRNFIAYLAKSAAVAYGEVDCSSPKVFGVPAIARLKQTTRSLFMRRTAACSIRFHAVRQGKFFPRYWQRSRAAAPDIASAMSLPWAGLTAAKQRVAFELSVVRHWIIERVMKAAAFFAAECRIDNQRGYRCEIAQLQ